MESVVNTIFKKIRLWEMFGEKTLSKSIGKGSSEFARVLKESMEWHSTSRTRNNRNEVKENVDRRPQFKMIKIDSRKAFHGSMMQRKTLSMGVRSALNGNHNGRLRLI